MRTPPKSKINWVSAPPAASISVSYGEWRMSNDKLFVHKVILFYFSMHIHVNNTVNQVWQAFAPQFTYTAQTRGISSASIFLRPTYCGTQSRSRKFVVFPLNLWKHNWIVQAERKWNIHAALQTLHSDNFVEVELACGCALTLSAYCLFSVYIFASHTLYLLAVNILLHCVDWAGDCGVEMEEYGEVSPYIKKLHPKWITCRKMKC